MSESVTIRYEEADAETWYLSPPRAARFGPDGKPADGDWLHFDLTNGSRRREALVIPKILERKRLRRSVMAAMAAWREDEYPLPCIRAYVYGTVTYEDGGKRRGLSLLLVDLEGTVRGIHPVEIPEGAR